ncbi:hypothetical protein [Burkholderia sp. Ax-1719]|uniref:hypothetical protein n=1 Tax=Burkholderia sp. Ax-1719 TaxID=2608334 RepID=UPI001F044EA7|nr:hypothetical protein [Burkholderia sp. Ax-1719]
MLQATPNGRRSDGVNRSSLKQAKLSAQRCTATLGLIVLWSSPRRCTGAFLMRAVAAKLHSDLWSVVVCRRMMVGFFCLLWQISLGLKLDEKLLIFLGPIMQHQQWFNKCVPKICQTVFNHWWHDLMDFPLDETIALKISQRLREHFL